jgi:betaine-aldehyde dehydrogenase
MYIDGRFVEAERGQTRAVYNPALGEVMAHVPEASAADVERAIAAARRAFDHGPWRKTTAQDRGRVLFKISTAIKAHAEELAQLDTMNMGKPIAEAEMDIADAATCFEYYGGLATKITGNVNPVPDEALNLTLREPIGACGQIIPWNYPLLMLAWKIAPALAAGCTMVLKPAEQTPLSALRFAQLIDEISELPKGVVNIVAGDGPIAGATLARSHSVDKIAFTGSLEVGRSILKTAAETNLKKVTLELGGKSPNIFFADADFEAAIDGALFGVFFNQGEVCSAGSRVLVEKSIYKNFVEAMVEKAKGIKLGNGMERGTKMGPLVSNEQRERVERYIAIGKQEGGKILLGGQRPGGELSRGYFVAPTIFDNVANDSRLGSEEVFGPVVALMPFESEDEAVQIANASPYGLAAAVWSKDFGKVMRVVKQVAAGVVWVNHMQPTFVEAPWGGYKQSGLGRELGQEGLEAYLQAKQVHINLNPNRIGWY